MQQDYDVTVIGAGITGLTTAYYLVKSGLRVAIVECNQRVGGQIATFEENGFIFESGPNTGVLSNLETVEIFEELNGLCHLETAQKASKKRLIYKKGRLHPLPSGPISAITTPLFTFKDKLRVLYEPFRAKGTNPDESVASLAARRLGQSFVDYAVDPFISGIYAGDPTRLVPRFALPKLYRLEQNYGSFIRGAIAKHKEPKQPGEEKITKEIFSAQKGLKHLPQALYEAIGSGRLSGTSHFFLGARETVLHPEGEGWSISFFQEKNPVTISSRTVVTTVGGYALPALLPFVDSCDLQPVQTLKYAGVVQVSVGLKKQVGYGEAAFGALVPTVERRNVLGILFPSSCFQGRAPEGGALYSLFIGGVKRPELLQYSDEALEKLVREELEKILRIPAHTNYDLFRIFRHEKAIPQYEADSASRYEAIKRIQERYGGLVLGGNIRDGIGMPDRIRQGKQMAIQISNLLKGCTNVENQ